MAVEKANLYFGAFVRAASPALIALLASSDRFIMADLYTITLVGGSVLRYSAAPTALFANGYTFALGPKFERSKTKIVIGTQVDELEVKIYTEPTDLIGGLPFLQAAWQGSSTRTPAARTRVHGDLWRYQPGNCGPLRWSHFGY